MNNNTAMPDEASINHSSMYGKFITKRNAQLIQFNEKRSIRKNIESE